MSQLDISSLFLEFQYNGIIRATTENNNSNRISACSQYGDRFLT